MGDFVQIHSLVSYPGVLLNRDDVGLAKRLPFGDSVRVRVSSQCLKRHWRHALAERHAELQPAVRSREIFSREIAGWLTDTQGVAPEVAESVTATVIGAVMKSAEKAERDDDGDAEGELGAASLASGQVIVMSPAEVEFLRSVALGLARGEGAPAEAEAPAKKGAKAKAKSSGLKLTKEQREQLAAVPAAFDAAMFGRFITSDVLARIDAAVSVAHAITVHGEQAETDYFTAVDELSGTSGAAMIGDTELTSGLFYVYVVVDLDQLKANLGPQAALANDLARWLIEAVATVSPGAKRGSTAPYAWSEFVLLERGKTQPRSLANAFRKSVQTVGGTDLLETAASTLLAERAKLVQMYGELAAVDRAALAVTRDGVSGVPVMPLPQAIATVLSA